MYKGQNIILPILFLIIILLGFEASNLQKQIQKNDSEKAQVQLLLTGQNKVAGFTCGVLNTEKAKNILKSDSLTKIFGQGPTDILIAGEANLDKIFWTDSCRYVDATNNTKYVEMYVFTFQADELAKNVFLKFIPEVNDKISISPDNYGQELIYDSGVYYLLQENRVIQVAASNGNPAETKDFSRQVFNELMYNLAL